MKAREIAVGAGALVVGALVVGALLLVLRARVSTTGQGAVDAPVASVEPTPLLPLEPQAYDDDDAGDVKDAGAPRVYDKRPRVDASRAPKDAAPDISPPAPRDAAVPGVRATNLLLHPVSTDRLCVDLSSHGRGLQLFTCHGRKNQRWVVQEDTGGIIRIESADGECIHVSGGAFTVAACDATSARFRHGEDRHFREIVTGLCMTAQKLETHGRLELATCDPANTMQQWGLGR